MHSPQSLLFRIKQLLDESTEDSMEAKVKHLATPYTWLAWQNFAYAHPCNDEVIAIQKALKETSTLIK